MAKHDSCRPPHGNALVQLAGRTGHRPAWPYVSFLGKLPRTAGKLNLLPSRPLTPTSPLSTGAGPLLKPKGRAARGVANAAKGEEKAVRREPTLEGGQYSRYAGYSDSEPTSGATPSAHFQESVPKCQPKRIPPEVPTPTPGKAAEPGRTEGTLPEFTPTALRQFSPAELEEERKRAEEFNAFLDAFPAPQHPPAAPNPAPVSSAWRPKLPARTPGPQGTSTPLANPPDQGAADVSEAAPAPGAKQAPPAAVEGKAAAVGSYPPLHRATAVTSLEDGPPPPLPPTALVGRHVTVRGSALPGIEGESGYVLEYDPFGERYHVQLNNGRVYHLVSRHLQLTQAPAKAVPLPPMQQHPLPATVAPKYNPPPVCFDRLKPDAGQPELGSHPPAPRLVGSTLGDPTATAGTNADKTVSEAGPAAENRPPWIPRSDPLAQVQQSIQKGTGHQRAPAPKPPPVRRVTLHYSCDPARPGPIAKPSAVDPWLLPPNLRKPELPAQAKPGPTPAAVQPRPYQDYRKTTPAADPKAAAPPAKPKGAVDLLSPRRTRPSTNQPPAYKPALGKGSARPPVPPIPKPAIETAAPAHVPEAEPEPPAPVHATEAEPEPNDPAFPTGNEEPEDAWESTRRVGGERTRPDWFDAHSRVEDYWLEPEG